MVDTTRKVYKYKINIKLTNNDENEEKEFTITNMTQILLQNFAEISNNGLPPGLTEENHIYMLKDNYYIDNDILKSIRATKGEKINMSSKILPLQKENKLPMNFINLFYVILIILLKLKY